MDFRIADTFTDSLARLTGEEQKAVKTTAFDLQLNPANPGLSFHKLNKARDKNFWSVRVSGDLRLIVHRAPGSLLLCYVDHHDGAYGWAERRKLETHPQTGAAQLVEIRERVEEIAIPRYVEVEPSAVGKPPLFSQRSDSELLSYGVPAEWLADVRQADEDSLLELRTISRGRRPRRCCSWRPADNRRSRAWWRLRAPIHSHTRTPSGASA
jgi:mRNA-degrading endonuclease RelE of RelBE toxin-antitoxin system